ncbi:TonB-dependent receptor [Caulobacter sp. KR2-114]|uniref:TonB-dependent receptor n=1 Tax=Caulobacter sp. KR2-114 TaxID=3400912 RepID=UPI003C0872F9
MNDTLKLRRWLALGASAMALGAIAAPAMAADAGAAAGAETAAPDQNTIDTLVVTAEKREQSVQDVPIAISAFGTKQRDLKGINTVQDMTNFTPGLVYSSTNDRASVRGVGRLTNIHSADAAVAIYIDGLYSTSTVFAGMPPLLVDRVEVLRGPQGTLYGRNSIGGIINIITQKPTAHWTGEVRAIGENYGYSDFQGTVSGPITDNLKFRLSGYKKDQRDGYFNNINAGMPSEGSKRNEYYVELQLAANLGEHAEAWFKYDTLHWDNRGGPGARSGYTAGAYDTTSTGIGPSNPLIYNAAYGYSGAVTGLTQFNGGTTTFNPPSHGLLRDFNTNTPLSVKLQNANQFSFNFVYHFPTFDVKYLTEWQHYHYSLAGDYDNTNVQSYQIPLNPNGICAHTAGCTALTVNPNETYSYDEVPTWWSHEINLTSTTDGPLQWVLGAYYYHEHYSNPQAGYDPSQTQLLHPIGGPANPTGLFNYTNYDMVTKSTAVFGQVDYKITDTLKVTGGLRYTRDTKYGTEYLRDVCYADSCMSSVYAGALHLPATLGGLDATGTAANWGSLLGNTTFLNALTGGAIPNLGSGGFDVTSSLLPCTTIAGTKGVSGTPVASAACAASGGYTQAHIDPATGLLTRGLSDSSSATTGTLRAEWTPNRDTLAYASYSRGYKAFGLYAGQLLTNPEAAPETVDAYEIGLKKDFGHTLQVNLSAFYYAYHNLQAPVQITTVNGYSTQFVNVAESRSSGIELDAVWQPIDHLQFSLDYSYNPTRITKSAMFADVNNNKNWGTTLSPLYYQPESVVGDSLPQAPKNKVALNGNYTFVLDAGKINVGANFIWRDKAYANIFTRSWNEAPSWDQVDLRGSWTPNNGKYQVIVYVKNVGNTLGYDAAALGSPRNIAYGNAANVYSLTPPRTYGIEVHYKFF